MAWLRLLPWAGWPVAAVVFWLWLEARDDLSAEIEACNTRTVESVAAAEKVTREATERAYKAQLDELAVRYDSEAKARRIAQAAAQAAESRPVKVRTVIKEVASANACLDAALPVELVRSLRD